MDHTRPILLLTRPEAASRRFREEFFNRFGTGWHVIVSPLIRIAYLDPALPDDLPRDIVFTSENAVRSFARLTRDRSARAWCVGEHTAAVAEAEGFRARSGPGDAATLGRKMIAEDSLRRVLYPRPVHAAGCLAESLDFAGIETISLVTYDQEEMPPDREAILAIAGEIPVLLPLFSPRSARLAGRAFAAANAPLLTASISSAVDAAFPLIAVRRVVAAEMTAKGVCDAIGRLIRS